MSNCNWVDINRGNMVDEFGFTLDWYLNDHISPNWKVVMSMSRRDHYDVYSDDVEVSDHEVDDNMEGDEEEEECIISDFLVMSIIKYDFYLKILENLFTVLAILTFI
ncbi:hypothetical protein LIER_38626 [Lithospermum erythrorhizon]|uniref:Transmembrane protein n=1 Tax=Lithospermum erythrorhizon TaxID=34254 RepID=A0AAV3Q595_LITER